MLDDPDGQPEEVVYPAHPLGVSLGQVVVDSHDMNTFAIQSIQIDWESSNQSFPLASLHFGDLAFVQYDASNQLDVEMPHVQAALRCFSYHCKSLVKYIVK